MKKRKSFITILCFICTFILCLTGCGKQSSENHYDPAENGSYQRPTEENEPKIEIKKPVIYLYGYCNDIDVSLSLSDDMQLTHTYPHYDGKWSIHASPDGTLTDSTGRKYDYLFWEGKSSNLEWDMSSGFCIKGEDTARFLEMILAKLGLNESESDDFITYWLPRMEDNPYNIISFQGNNYTDAVDIVPSEEPDAEIRVYMVWYGSDKPVDDLPVQKIKDNSDYVRFGKTVVEWGGTELYERF